MEIEESEDSDVEIQSTLITFIKVGILTIICLVILTGDAGVGKSNFLIRYRIHFIIF